MKQKNNFNNDATSKDGRSVHRYGVGVENAINRNERILDTERGGTTRYVSYQVVSNGQKYIVKYHIKNGNIVSVDPPKPVN